MHELTRWKTRMWVASVIVLAAGAAAPKAATEAVEIQPGAELVAQKLRRVADGIYLLAQDSRFHEAPIGNVVIVEQSDGIILVDSGGNPPEGFEVVAQVRALTTKPVKAVIVTHWHDDHTLGLPAIVKAWPGVRVIAAAWTAGDMRTAMSRRVPYQPDSALDAARRGRMEKFIEELSARGADPSVPMAIRRQVLEQAAEIGARAPRFAGAHIVLPTEIVTDEITLPDRRTPLRVTLLGRANTRGDLVIEAQNQKILIAGDIVVAPIPFGFNSYPADWIDVLKDIGRREFDLLIPGHGPPQRDRAYLRLLSWSIEDLRRQVRPLAVQGFSLEETQGRIRSEEHLRRFAGDDPYLRERVMEYWLQPMIENAYREARGLPISP